MQIIRTQTQVGDIFIPEKDVYIRKALLEHKIWEPNTLKLCLDRMTSESIVVEVGSHVGTHTIALAKHSRFVYAFEMQRLLFQILNVNCMFNGVTNVIPFLGGVSNENKKTYSVEVDWKEAPEINTGNIKIEKLTDVEQAAKSFYAMDIVKLDDHLKLLPYLTLLKIDVEGHEHKVLEGAKHLIKKFKPIIITECHGIKTDYTGERGNVEMIENILKECGDYKITIYKETIKIEGKPLDNLNLLAVPK